MTTIITKNSSTAGAAPLAADLVQGELAVNVTSKALYTKNASAAVVKLNTPSIVDNGDATAITIDSSENVGIGTSSPTSKLFVSSTGAISGRFASTQATNYLELDNSTGGAGIASNGDALTFWTSANGTERARIDSSGNLLVGTTSVDGRLSIQGAGATSATYCYFGRNSGGTGLFYVRNDGAGFLNAASWTYNSDRAIKENIEYLDSQECLTKILQSKPAKFDYINGQKKNYGYIANDVEEWLPDAIEMTEAGTRALKDGFINTLGTGAIKALHELIQEQQAMIAEQSTLITTLTERITALEQA